MSLDRLFSIRLGNGKIIDDFYEFQDKRVRVVLKSGKTYHGFITGFYRLKSSDTDRLDGIIFEHPGIGDKSDRFGFDYIKSID